MAAPRHAATKATNPAHRVPAEWLPWATADSGANNRRFIVTSLKHAEARAPYLWEAIYCGRGEMENRTKEYQLGLFADRTSAATMRANQLRLWFASMAYVLLCALRRIGLAQTQFAAATCATIRLKLLKIVRGRPRVAGQGRALIRPSKPVDIFRPIATGDPKELRPESSSRAKLPSPRDSQKPTAESPQHRATTMGALQEEIEIRL
jgi:Transposase DDE domain group 1